MSKKYIEVPARALLERLRDISSKIEKSGGRTTESTQGREIVFDLTPRGREAFVRVYTSLARGDDAVRGCGEDAVRLVVGTEFGGKFRPLAKSRRIYRTAPQGPEEERIAAFLGRLTQALREAYRQATNDHPSCPKCGSPMARRTAKATGNEFFGCLRWPDCRGTLNIKSSKKDAKEMRKSPSRKRQQSRETTAACKQKGSAAKQLEHMLKTHDWTSDLSDDAQVQQRSTAHLKEIHMIIECVEPSVAHELWNEYAPFYLPLHHDQKDDY